MNAAYVDEVVAALDRLDDVEWLRENPILLAGSGRTLDSLPAPLPPEVVDERAWKREHGDHYQYFIRIGQDRFGPVQAWGCVDCNVPEPDAVNLRGDWAVV